MIRTHSSSRNLALASLLILAFATLSCASNNPSGVYYAKGKNVTTADGLRRVLWEPFTVTYVKPGADLQKYNSVLIDAVTISYKRPPKKTVYTVDSDDRNFALTPTMQKSMGAWFRKSFVAALTQSDHYKLVEKPGPDTLAIDGHLVDLQITVPSLQQQADDETLLTASSGAVTLILDVRDSETHDPLVRVGIRQSLDLDGDPNILFVSNDVRTSGEFKELFEIWSGKLARELEQLSAVPMIPEPKSDGG